MRTLEEYLTLPYPIELQPEKGGGFTALHPDLPGCVAWGDTVQQAVANLADSRAAWIEGSLARRLAIPEPAAAGASGRVTLRLPTDLHAALARSARRQKVSLNTWIVTNLAASNATERLSSELIARMATLLQTAAESPAQRSARA